MTSDRTDAAPAARTPVPPQPAPPGRRLAEILGGLALASDVANGFPDGKAIRTALLAALLLQRSAAAERDARNAYFVTLLRFTGCTAFAHEEASRYGAGDDTGVRNAMALADVADRVGTFAMIARGVARGAPLAVRAAAIGRLVGDGRAMTEHAHAQCDASVHVATAFGVGDDLQSALRFV
ncbi:MAG TPA: hypothetical protein VM491_08180, partial [Burkholderiaceae bacterium]|nr:hypothetical protein [Burkholderiaceae bacterium]